MNSVFDDVGKLKHDLTGKRFGHFVVLERVIDYTKSMTQWLCQCDCGKTKIMTGWVLRHSVEVTKPNPPINCGCLKYCGKPKNRRYANPQTVAHNHVYGQYKHAAQRRKIAWDLTKEQFRILIERDCHYCGITPSRVYNPYQWHDVTNDLKKKTEIVMNGVDRLDNNVGYTIDNCVPCCSECNYAKRAIHVNDFLAWIDRVYKHQHKLLS